MYRFIVNILLVACFTLPSWGEYAGLAYVGEIEWNKCFLTKVELECDTTATDTVWTMRMEGDMSDGYILLIKTGDSKVIELHQCDHRWNHVTDSIGHSQLTGEIMEFYHYEQVLYYPITSADLEHIAAHGISKIRCGTDTYFMETTYKDNEFGKRLEEAYKKILEKMSPEYVPPKKPSIRDGF